GAEPTHREGGLQPGVVDRNTVLRVAAPIGKVRAEQELLRDFLALRLGSRGQGLALLRAPLVGRELGQRGGEPGAIRLQAKAAVQHENPAPPLQESRRRGNARRARADDDAIHVSLAPSSGGDPPGQSLSFCPAPLLKKRKLRPRCGPSVPPLQRYRLS